MIDCFEKAFATVVLVWKKKHLIKVDWRTEIYHHARPPLPSASNCFGQVRQEMVKSYCHFNQQSLIIFFPCHKLTDSCFHELNDVTLAGEDALKRMLLKNLWHIFCSLMATLYIGAE